LFQNEIEGKYENENGERDIHIIMAYGGQVNSDSR